jgi:hypothetical protein
MSATPPAQPKLECICGTLGVIGQRATFCYSPMARNWRRAGDHQSSGASVSAVFSSNTTGGPHEFLDPSGIRDPVWSKYSNAQTDTVFYVRD